MKNFILIFFVEELFFLAKLFIVEVCGFYFNMLLVNKKNVLVLFFGPYKLKNKASFMTKQKLRKNRLKRCLKLQSNE